MILPCFHLFTVLSFVAANLLCCALFDHRLMALLRRLLRRRPHLLSVCPLFCDWRRITHSFSINIPVPTALTRPADSLFMCDHRHMIASVYRPCIMHVRLHLHFLFFRLTKNLQLLSSVMWVLLP